MTTSNGIHRKRCFLKIFMEPDLETGVRPACVDMVLFCFINYGVKTFDFIPIKNNPRNSVLCILI